MGDLRAYPGGRQVIYLESNDAGALLRFTDIYSRVVGGQMWIAMDPPTADQRRRKASSTCATSRSAASPQLERVAANGDRSDAHAAAIGAGVSFSRMRAEFTRSPGKLAVARRRGVGAGDRRDASKASSITRTTTCACAARSCRPMR